MQLPNFGTHNKIIWVALVGGAVVLGLYLRRRANGTGSDGSSDMPNQADISGNALDPYSTMGSGTADTTGGATGPAGPAGPAGPRGPRGKNGHTKNQHHGHNHHGHSGNGGGNHKHHHKAHVDSIVASEKRNRVNPP